MRKRLGRRHAREKKTRTRVHIGMQATPNPCLHMPPLPGANPPSGLVVEARAHRKQSWGVTADEWRPDKPRHSRRNSDELLLRAGRSVLRGQGLLQLHGLHHVLQRTVSESAPIQRRWCCDDAPHRSIAACCLAMRHLGPTSGDT